VYQRLKKMNNKVLCTCFKCKKNGTGKYVHPTTKWRHAKNAKKKYNLGLNELDDDDDNGLYDDDRLNDDDGLNDDNKIIFSNRLLLRVKS
jgi:hypothetical protein